MAPHGNDPLDSPRPLELRQPAPGPAAGGDDLDDLLNNYDFDDPFADDLPVYKPPSPVRASNANSNGNGNIRKRGAAALGIDEEIEVEKKYRAPRAKLDEERLLGPQGIPKLKTRAAALKFRGKGHEFSDAARLLEMYQLWLDDLFPKARFLDAAAMVEKLGHKKRIQVMRNQWIDEGRPRQSVFEESLFDEPSLPRREDGIGNGREERVAPIFEKMRASELPPARHRTPVGEPFDDLFDATPVARRVERPAEADDVPPANDSIFANGTGSIFGGPAAKKVDEEDFGDDLDALLAEAEMDGAAAPALGKDTGPPPPEPDFDDDEEAMAEMGW